MRTALRGVIVGCRKLVERANEWLYKNTEVQVRSCETITWMSHDAKQLDDGEQMVLTQSIEEDGNTSCLRGFRWTQILYAVTENESIHFVSTQIEMCRFSLQNTVRCCCRLLTLRSQYAHCTSSVCPSVCLSHRGL